MIDELLDERTFASSPAERQQTLLAEHCRGIIGLIKTAHDSEQAASIVDRACDAFERECESTLVRNALSAYLKAILREWWDSRE